MGADRQADSQSPVEEQKEQIAQQGKWTSLEEGSLRREAIVRWIGVHQVDRMGRAFQAEKAEGTKAQSVPEHWVVKE